MPIWKIKNPKQTFGMEVILHRVYQKKTISHISMNYSIEPDTLSFIPVFVWNL